MVGDQHQQHAALALRRCQRMLRMASLVRVMAEQQLQAEFRSLIWVESHAWLQFEALVGLQRLAAEIEGDRKVWGVVGGSAAGVLVTRMTAGRVP